MNVRTILGAHEAINDMQIDNVPYKVVRGVQKLKAILEEETGIARERQIYIIKKTGGEVEGQKRIVFPSAENRIEYEREMDDLLDSDVDLLIDPLDLTQYVDNIKFKNANVDIDSLSTFIIFDAE